jgi:hypothetical protein
MESMLKITVTELYSLTVMISMLATGPKVHGIKPNQQQWLFKGNKNLQHASDWRGSKAISPIS